MYPKNHGQAFNGTIWVVVGVLAVIALIIFIVTHVNVG